MNKITFHLTELVKKKLTNALLKYGDFEIGGILIGRKINQETFEIIDACISDEDNHFSLVSFVRGIKKSEQLLKRHFRKQTGYYIGEWHSHPKFTLNPSVADINTMIGILHDPNYGASFVILLIVHIDKTELKHRGFFFHKDLKEIIPLE